MGQTTIFLTDSEQWTLETTDQEQWSTVCETWLDTTCWIGAHWSWLGKIHPWPHPLPFPSQGTADDFRCAQAICFRHLWMQPSPGHQGKLCDTQKQQLLWFLGSFSERFIWSLSVAALQGNGDMWLSPLCTSHTSLAMEQPPVESRSCFYCLGSYTIYSFILLLCINFLSWPGCHICTVTSWFPIFNCPQRASSRATPAFVGALICHCPNWSSKHLKFTLYEHVVFLQVRD